MKNNKKLIGIGLICIGLIILLIYFAPKNIKADVLFGTSECTMNDHISTTDISGKRCMLCFSKFKGASSNASICTNCAHQLGRCSASGKIRNSNYHFEEK